MLSKEDRDEINGSPFLRDLMMEQTFDLVTYFYPDLLLTIRIYVKGIRDIMNCNEKTARGILRKAQKNAGKKRHQRLTLSDLCDYLEVDDMLIQLFLASLKSPSPPPRLQIIAADRTDKPLREVDEAMEDVQQGIIIHMPLALYNELNPLGEPMYKRFGFYRCIVRAYEVAQIYECHIDTARAMLREVRAEKDLPARAHVSIEKFCKVHHLIEDDFRESLASIHEDEKNVADDD